MRTTLTRTEAIDSALELVKKELSAGLSLPIAISVVAGRTGVKVEALEYFYKINNLNELVFDE